MPKHYSTPSKTLFGQEQSKNTKISEFLKGVPFLTFSDKGLENIAKRFHLTTEELQQKIADLQKGGRE